MTLTRRFVCFPRGWGIARGYFVLGSRHSALLKASPILRGSLRGGSRGGNRADAPTVYPTLFDRRGRSLVSAIAYAKQ